MLVIFVLRPPFQYIMSSVVLYMLKNLVLLNKTLLCLLGLLHSYCTPIISWIRCNHWYQSVFFTQKKGLSDVQTHCLFFSCYDALLGCWWHIAWFIWEREIRSLTICGRVWRRDILGNLGCWFALLDQITAPSAGIYIRCALVESIIWHIYSLPYFAL